MRYVIKLGSCENKGTIHLGYQNENKVKAVITSIEDRLSALES